MPRPASLPPASLPHPIVEPGRIVTRDGVALAYSDWAAKDSESSPAVLFVHSWAVSSEIWHYQRQALCAQGLRCVAFDRRSHGKSSDPGRGYDFDTLADDLAQVIEALDLRDLTLVGHSMACGEIVRYLTRHGPGRVARIALVAPAPTPFPMKTANNPIGLDASVFEQVRQAMLTDLPKWLADNAAPFVVPETSPAMLDWLMRMILDTPLHAAIECQRSGTSTDFRAELPKIELPCLILHGDKDASAPLELTGRPTAALIPGSWLEVYEGAPHGLFITHKDRLNADLLRFVRANC